MHSTSILPFNSDRSNARGGCSSSKQAGQNEWLKSVSNKYPYTDHTAGVLETEEKEVYSCLHMHIYTGGLTYGYGNIYDAM